MSSAMIEMTTSSSMSVKPLRVWVRDMLFSKSERVRGGTTAPITDD